MDILFCDLCNESVPQADLDLGWAFRRKGRVICARCDASMSSPETVASAPAAEPVPGGEAPARPKESAPASRAEPTGRARRTGRLAAAGVVLAVIALGLTATGAVLFLRELERERERSVARVLALEHDMAALGRRQRAATEALERDLAEREQRLLEDGDALRTELAASVARLGEDLTEARSDAGRTAERLALLETASQQSAERGRQDVERLTARDARMDEDLRFFRDRLIEMEEAMRGLRAGAPAAGPAASAGVPAWHGLLADLEHANAGIRLEAVYQLGETRDPAVVSHLVPLLRDDDLFVRIATARTLEDLDAREAVPALIDALEDSESAVKEAAVIALRRITGQNFRFDPLASEAERAKRVKAWREWWERSGPAFLGG